MISFRSGNKKGSSWATNPTMYRVSRHLMGSFVDSFEKISTGWWAANVAALLPTWITGITYKVGHHL